MRLWRRVTELTDAVEPDQEAIELGLYSRMLQLEYAWRLGIDREASRRWSPTRRRSPSGVTTSTR